MSLSNKRSEPITNKQMVMTYGKFRGRTIGEILEEEPSYLLWLHTNSDTFELSAELYDIACGDEYDERDPRSMAYMEPHFYDKD
jgi:hypothetical protein